MSNSDIDIRKREKEERRRLRSWKMLDPIMRISMHRILNYTYDQFDPDSAEGPIIVVINHTCAIDPILVGVAFRKKPMSFVASEHLLRVRPWGPLIDKYFSIIPHTKGNTSSRTALNMIKRIRRGESLFLAPEGEQTWDGVSMEIKPLTGGIVKKSGATLVTFRLEGGYLTHPRWAYKRRKGKVVGRIRGIYSPETLKEMEITEIEEQIVKDLYFDTWEWQKSMPGGPVRFRCRGGKTAEGLERFLFSCPECGRMGTLSTRRDRISCACGMSVRLSETGFFDQPAPFETIPEWAARDREILTGEIREITANCESSGKDSTVVFSDENAALYKIGKEHTEEEAASGRLTLSVRRKPAAESYADLRFQPGAKLQQARLIGASDAVLIGGAQPPEINASDLTATPYDPEESIYRHRELQLLRASVGDCYPPLMVENGTRRLRGGGHPVSVILSVGDREFDLMEIKEMALVLAGRILFSDDSGYYEIRSARTNMFKYVLAREICRGDTD